MEKEAEVVRRIFHEYLSGKNAREIETHFNAELFGELIDKIIVESNDSIRFRLKNGQVIKRGELP